VSLPAAVPDDDGDHHREVGRAPSQVDAAVRAPGQRDLETDRSQQQYGEREVAREHQDGQRFRPRVDELAGQDERDENSPNPTPPRPRWRAIA
jgi:hypothetical protein